MKAARSIVFNQIKVIRGYYGISSLKTSKISKEKGLKKAPIIDS